MYDSAGGASEAFLDSLDLFVKRMDGDIERLCNKNYQGFIDSVEELLRVRRNAEKFQVRGPSRGCAPAPRRPARAGSPPLAHCRAQDQIGKASAAVRQTGEAVVKSLEELARHRHIQRNILVAIEALGHCIPVIRLYNKAQAQLAGRRFYPTLRTLQELEGTHLPSVAQYPFAAKIRERVPAMRLRVKQTSFAELQEFLRDIRDGARLIGETALLQVGRGRAVLLCGGQRGRRWLATR